MTRSRVLHVPTVRWRPEEGVSRCVFELARAMPDVESHLVADRPAGAPFTSSEWLGSLAGWLTHPDRAGRLLDAVQPDVVHVHGGILAPVFAYSLALRGTPVVASVYHLPELPPTRRWSRTFLADLLGSTQQPLRILASHVAGVHLARHALRSGRMAAVCTPDRRIEQELAGFGRVELVPGAATLLDKRAGWSVPPTVVFAGRAETGRGIEELLAAHELLQERFTGVRLRLLLLPGKAADQLRRICNGRRDVDLVIGPVDDLDAELLGCQVAALPFRHAMTITPSLVAAEAMAAGLPVVGTDVPSLAPLIADGVNGRLATFDPHALADAIAQVIKDPDEWQRLSDGARRTIEVDWAWSAAAARVREVYEHVLDRPSSVTIGARR